MMIRMLIVLIPNGDGTWFAQIPQIRGLMTEGDSVEDALWMIGDALKTYVEALEEDGERIIVKSEVDRQRDQIVDMFNAMEEEDV